MATLNQRLDRIERKLGNQQCIACASMPCIFVIRRADDNGQVEERLKWRQENCTCGRPFQYRKVILRHGSGEVLPPAANSN